MDIHEVVHYLALDVVLDSVDQKSLAHIHHLDKRKIPGAKKENSPRVRSLRIRVGYRKDCYRYL